MRKIIFNTLLFFSISLNSFSQFIVSEANPASLKWKQINNEHFQILFPEGFEGEALRTASILEKAYSYVSKNLNHYPEKVTVILQNQGSVSNGFVVWAPKRSEFLTTPAQNFDTNDWLATLAVHEFRHVVQISKLNQGITKVLYYIIGEQGVTMTQGLIPKWFFEGDAVHAETVLTEGGRGRRVDFGMALRAQLLEQGKFGYEKASFGSYRNIVDDHYKMGFHMVSYVRNKYGDDSWEKTLNYMGRRPYVPFPFSHGVKKATGYHSKEIYTQMLQEIDSIWKMQDSLTHFFSVKKINERNSKTPTNYRLPKEIGKNKIVAVKNGFNDITQFVLLDTLSNETPIHIAGNYLFDQLSVRKRKMVWVEYIPDLRWAQANSSDIKIYDIDSLTEKRLTYKRKLFSPSLSPDVESIIAVNISVNNDCSLEILDAKSGSTKKQLNNPENYFYSYPTWVNNNEIVSIIQKNNKKGMVLLNTQTEEYSELIPLDYTNLSNPYVFGNYVYFHAEYSGIMNIYSLDLQTKEMFQVSSVRFGAFNPSISLDGKYVYFQNYTSEGYDIVKMPNDKDKWIPLKDVVNNRLNYYENSINKVEHPNILDSIQVKNYEITEYNKLKNLVNIHSWAPITHTNPPYLSTLSDSTARLGFTLLSQNKLSDFVTVLSYEHSNNAILNSSREITRDAVSFSSTYSGLFPILNLKGYYIKDETQLPDRIATAITTRISPGVVIPLNFSTDRYTKTATFSARQTINSFRGEGLYSIESPTRYELRGNNILKVARNNLLPRWGQSIILGYTHDLMDVNANVFNSKYLIGIFYLPGLNSNSTIKIMGAYVWHSNDLNNFDPLRGYGIVEPRGLSYLSKANSLMKLEYHTPLFYPDLNVSFISYIKRVNCTLFYDITNYASIGAVQDIPVKSYGFELIADMNLFRFYQDFKIGFRYSTSPTSSLNKSRYEPVVKMNF